MDRRIRTIQCVLLMVVISMAVTITIARLTEILSPVLLFAVSTIFWISAFISIFLLLVESIRS